MTSKSQSAAPDATAPTSRATFRLLARSAGATNREADTLRHALLAQWTEQDGVEALVERLEAVEPAESADGSRVDALLAVWFSFAAPTDGHIVAKDDPILAGLSDELCDHLASVTGPTAD